ncbi:MAG: hypothetical protein AAFR21_04305 [Pseudomonadota bacterium]
MAFRNLLWLSLCLAFVQACVHPATAESHTSGHSSIEKIPVKCGFNVVRRMERSPRCIRLDTREEVTRGELSFGDVTEVPEGYSLAITDLVATSQPFSLEGVGVQLRLIAANVQGSGDALVFRTVPSTSYDVWMGAGDTVVINQFSPILVVQQGEVPVLSISSSVLPSSTSRNVSSIDGVISGYLISNDVLGHMGE